jgi:hypothetical protein
MFVIHSQPSQWKCLKSFISQTQFIRIFFFCLSRNVENCDDSGRDIRDEEEFRLFCIKEKEWDKLIYISLCIHNKMKLSSRNEKKTLCEVSSLSSGVSRRNVIIMCQNRASGRHIVCSNYISLAYSRHLSTATQHRRVKQTYVNIVKRILPHIFF